MSGPLEKLPQVWSGSFQRWVRFTRDTLSLVERSRNETDLTIVSIYVNPTQFNNQNDLANYPDTLTLDLQLLEAAGVSAVFMPTYELLYPDNFAYEVDEKQFSRELCGANRPGHFTGVLTVVMKLLNIVKPQKAYFGEKDFQQLSLVKGHGGGVLSGD